MSLPFAMLPPLCAPQHLVLLQDIIAEGYLLGSGYYNLCGYQIRASLNEDMCYAQQYVLQSCPEFVNDWCYQDLGGTQQLRSPCPKYLKCHYCLGLNPLHCLASNAN